MSKHPSRSPRRAGDAREHQPRWLLYAWFHPEIVPGLRCRRCHERPGVVRFDDYFPQPSRQELRSAPLEEAAERLFAALLAEQAALGPRVHRSEPYCFACTRQHLDAISGGPSALAGLKTNAAMQGLAGRPGVAVRADTSTATNVLLISSERTRGAAVQAACRHLPGSGSGLNGPCARAHTTRASKGEHHEFYAATILIRRSAVF